MSLRKVLAKLTKEDKMVILQNIAILPAIEEDYSLSKEELGNILTAGAKMGFEKEEIMAEVQKKSNEIGATIEK